MCKIAIQLCIQYKLHKRSQYPFPSPICLLLMNFCSQGALGHPTSAVRNKIICNPQCQLKVFFSGDFSLMNIIDIYIIIDISFLIRHTGTGALIIQSFCFYRCFLYAYQIIRLTKQSRIQVIVWSSIGGHKMEHKQLHHTKLKKDKTRTLCKVERNLFQMENTFDIFCFFLREQYLK